MKALFFLSIHLLGLFSGALFAIEKHGMTYEEIVALNKPQWVSLFSSEEKVAFTTRHGSLAENRSIDSLYIYDVKEMRQQKICDTDEIAQGLWSKSGTFYYVKHEGNMHSLVRFSDKEEPLFETSRAISTFAFSPDESQIFIALPAYSSPSEELARQQKECGYVFQGKNRLGEITVHKENEEIWLLDIASKQMRLLSRLSYENWVDHLWGLIVHMQVSDDGTKLLAKVAKRGRNDLGGFGFANDVYVLDLAQEKWYYPMPSLINDEEAPCWLDGSRFVFLERYTDRDKLCSSVWLFDADTEQKEQLDWFNFSNEIDNFVWDGNQSVLYALCTDCIYRLYIHEKRFEKIECKEKIRNAYSFDPRLERIAFIAQSSEEPPEIAICDLANQETRKVTSLNPQLANIALGHVEEVLIETENAKRINGFLLHPVDEEAGKRYPIILASYGFSGDFLADAEWHSSFAAQTLAAKGYLVFMINCHSSQGLTGDPELARQIEGWNDLAFFERAIDILVERGIGDPTKVGLYGWSHGAFIVNFLISHSNRFHAASLGEGGDYNPSAFWIFGNLEWSRTYENIFGGPPWGDTLKNYLDFSPFFCVDKIQTPLLMEYADIAILGFEMYTPLRYLGVPAEIFIYPNEEHNFVKPKARVTSMARKVDWFDYWLLGKRSGDPEKREQYARWDAMRQQWAQASLPN